MAPSSPSGPISAESLVGAYVSGCAIPVSEARSRLKLVERFNPLFNAFITVLGDSALKSAEESERRYREGAPLGPLDGVPMAVKDVFYIQGVRCTAGSKILADNVAPYDAPVVAKLRAAGAVILGTTNLHEFAAGTTSTNPHYGAVRNPWDPARVAGGSSGGSAVAVSAGIVPLALGTDTAGSVRIPGALCGVLGLKPTYGRVSRLGVVPLSTSLDTVGVLSASSTGAGHMLRAVAGHDADDMTTISADVPDYGSSPPLTSARVGVIRNRARDMVDLPVEENFQRFIAKLRSIGCSVSEVDLDGLPDVYDRWLPIRRAEATAFHLRWLESSPELYGEDVRRLLELGKDVLAVDYVNAINSRPSFMERFSASMKGVDVLALPCTCITAPKVGETSLKVNGKERQVYSLLNSLTLPFNYVGFPALSIPSGFVGGLPLGVQLVGKLFDEDTLLRVGRAVEDASGPFPSPPLSRAVPTG